MYFRTFYGNELTPNTFMNAGFLVFVVVLSFFRLNFIMGGPTEVCFLRHCFTFTTSLHTVSLLLKDNGVIFFGVSLALPLFHCDILPFRLHFLNLLHVSLY